MQQTVTIALAMPIIEKIFSLHVRFLSAKIAKILHSLQLTPQLLFLKIVNSNTISHPSSLIFHFLAVPLHPLSA
jgi:hypothetical protein